MTNKEKLLLIKFLEEFSYDLSNRGCNDIDEKLFNDWTEKEKSSILKELNKYYDSDYEDVTDAWDVGLVDFLAFKLEQEISSNADL